MAAHTQNSEYLTSHYELPAWARDNPLIRGGYRRPGGTALEKSSNSDSVVNATGTNAAPRTNGKSPSARDQNRDGEIPYEHDSFAKCWKSIWAYWHNESVNIHTHLWGAVFSVTLAALHILHQLEALPSFANAVAHHSLFYPESLKAETRLGQTISFAAPTSPSHAASMWARPPDWKDRAGFATFLTGAVLCLGFSATYHTVGCHSRDVSKRFNKLDYIGIVVMIVGSFFPALHYGFYCHPHLQAFYCLAITIMGAFATYTVINAKYATPAYRPIRTSVFLVLGLSATFPVAHVISMYGYETVVKTMGLSFLLSSGTMYVVGACLYMARVPERFAPGRFDYIGASHQIFHIFILCAAFAHYISIRRAYAFWHTVQALGGEAGRGAVCAALEGMRR